MNHLNQKTLNALIKLDGAMDGFWIGRYQALRNEWLSKARRTNYKDLKSQYVRYAREYHHSLIEKAKIIRKSGEKR